MFYRKITRELEKWRERDGRKPLIVRGARQVGKTTVVKSFAGQFEQFIYLNLELPEDRKPFDDFTSFETLVQSLFFLKNKLLTKRNSTLIFIDEIQEVPEALQQLRYFYEQAPDIAVIAAGSLLESLFSPDISFPVGRVEYLVIHPVSFPEYLGAIGEHSSLEQLETVPVQDFAHDKLLQQFHTYSVIGGMPEVVEHYARSKDITSLERIYDSLLISYMDDVEKYASGDTQAAHIRHAMQSAFAEAGKRIKFAGFGNSQYKSREMGEALRALEKALLIHLVYPQTSVVLPLMPDRKKSPRLHVLDTGLLNYLVGIQRDIIGTDDLSRVYQGTMIEHLAGQELLATGFSALHGLNFWVREKNTSMAEVDYIYNFNGKLIPVEVKSGSEGKLKSLHQYMELAPHTMAVRIYSGKLSISTIKINDGKSYFLLNLPYYLTSQIRHYLEWFENRIA